MWAAWRYGGEDPWRTYNMLGADYRPIGAPDLPEVKPTHPRRYKAFLYACARVSARMEGKVDKILPPPPGVKPKPAPKRKRRR